MLFKVTWKQFFYIASLRTFEVDAKLSPFNVGVWRAVEI
jgi:hypothetical protein